MTFFRWKLYHYSLPLTEPLSLLGHEMRVRTGLILRLHVEDDRNPVDNNFGEGEIAPLPGMHLETLSEAEIQIQNYLSGNFHNTSRSANLFGSVNFGLDMALRTMFHSSNTHEFNNSRFYHSYLNFFFTNFVSPSFFSSSDSLMTLECCSNL